ncbi:hypothetical protein NL676_007356 [Syzygium grande]|nr:hypothetical protein NL676_007356 [Syzygium grande]
MCIPLGLPLISTTMLSSSPLSSSSPVVAVAEVEEEEVLNPLVFLRSRDLAFPIFSGRPPPKWAPPRGRRDAAAAERGERMQWWWWGSRLRRIRSSATILSSAIGVLTHPSLARHRCGGGVIPGSACQHCCPLLSDSHLFLLPNYKPENPDQPRPRQAWIFAGSIVFWLGQVESIRPSDSGLACIINPIRADSLP